MAKATTKTKKKRKSSLASRNARIGFLFILPWIIGFAVLFLYPALQSLKYSFMNWDKDAILNLKGQSDAAFTLANYEYALTGDATYIRDVVSSLGTMVYEVPLITFFSMFIAGLLNQKFAGRTIARMLFFLPVIIASGGIISILQSGGMSTSIGGEESIYMFKTTAMEDILVSTGISQDIINFLTTTVSKIFDITWKSGIQILLFLSGLQGVPSSYYEVSSMEGATAWEEFWKITFPLLSPTTLIAVVYTIVDSFTDYRNVVMTDIQTAYGALELGRSAAYSWIYFVIIGIIIFLVNKIIFSKTVYIEE